MNTAIISPKKCELCDRQARDNSRLCLACNLSRLQAASIARIMAGTGLTFSNVVEFSEENWIREENCRKLDS